MRPLVLLLAVCLGCTLYLPAPGPPPRYTPRLDPPPGTLAPGHGRVIVDALNGPARVSVVEPAGERFVCLSPCAVDLPPGTHQLHLVAADDREETLPVVVADDAAVYQGILGVKRERSRARRIVLAGAVAGVALLAYGLTATLTSKQDPHSLGYTTDNGLRGTPNPSNPPGGEGPGLVLAIMGGGLALGLGAATLWLADEQQPSTFVRWSPEAAAP